MPEELYKKAFEKIKSANRILAITHDRPDGDALSSTCAMLELLKTLDKDCTAYCFDSPPRQFDFLPHIDMIKSDRGELDFFSFDLIIVLDCGGLNRTKLSEEINNKKPGQYIIEFDHHPKIDNYADIEIKKPESSSTSEMLYEFFKANGININKNIANCILAGIMTDTANFLYTSATDKTIKIASEMLLSGARYPRIFENTWRNKSLPAMKIWGRAIDNLKINEKYNLGFSVLTAKDLLETGTADKEFEGLAGFLGNLYGIKALLLLREEGENIIKGSLRTDNSNIDISLLAQLLGGAGHPRASGFVIRGKIEESGKSWKIV